LDSYDTTKHLQIQDEFVKRLSNKSGYELFNYSDGVFYGNLPVVFKKATGIKYFRDKGIEANKYYKPLVEFANSTNLYKKIINFPLHEDIDEGEINTICEAIESYDSSN
jgi:hypothetical protein